MRKAMIFTVVIILLLVFAVGCAPKKTSTISTSKVSPTEKIRTQLEEKMTANSLAEVYDPAPRVDQGSSKTNYILVKNSYTSTHTFKFKNLGNTSLAEFPEDGVDIGPYDTELIQFKVNADQPPGEYEQDVKITDINNNAYAAVKLLIIIE